MIEEIAHGGEIYHRIHPRDVNLDAMTEIQKVTSVFAVQVGGSEPVPIKTVSCGIVETENLANPSDWIVFNLAIAMLQTY